MARKCFKFLRGNLEISNIDNNEKIVVFSYSNSDRYTDGLFTIFFTDQERNFDSKELYFGLEAAQMYSKYIRENTYYN